MAVTNLETDTAWRRRRALVLIRDAQRSDDGKPACVRCGAHERLAVAHCNGDLRDDRLANLETLCTTCSDGARA